MTRDAFSPGTQLEGYRIVRALGRGGMGAVYAATDESLGRDVALKVVLPELGANDAFLARFRREAKAAAKVNHPNVAAVHRVGELGGRPFVAMELLPGGSLKDKLEKEGPIPGREVARLGAGIARGLAAIHAKGLVHRDVKPDNVLLDEHGTPKLTDFGLVRPTSASSLSGGGLTKEGDVLGTLEYIAPEQIDGGDAVGPSADLYALGATLYVLATGRPPFEGQGYALIAKHLRERPTPSRSRVSDLPLALDVLILRLLEKEPANRPASAGEVADELEKIARGELGDTSSRSRALIAIAAAIAVAGIAVGVAIATRGGEPPPAPPPEKVATTPDKPAPTPAPPKPTTPKPVAPRFEVLPCKPTALESNERHLSLARVLGDFEGKHAAPVNGLDVNGKLAATGGFDGSLFVWDLSKPGLKQLHSLRGHKTVPDRLSFTPSGRRLVSGSYIGDGIFAWNPTTGERIHEWPRARFAMIHCLDERLAVVSTARTLGLFDLETGEVVKDSSDLGAPIGPFVLDRETRTIAACSVNAIITIPVDALGREAPRTVMTTPARFSTVAIDAHSIAAGTPDGNVWLLSRDAPGDPVVVKSHSGFVYQIALLKHERLISGGVDGSLVVTDMKARAVTKRLPGHADTVFGIAVVSEDEAITSSKDGSVRRWDLSSGPQKSSSPSDWQCSSVVDLAVTATGALVSCSRDGTIRRWSEEGKSEPIATRRPDCPNAIAVSRDGRRILSAWESGAVVLSEGGSQHELRGPGPNQPMLSAWIAADGKTGATGGKDEIVTFWDLDSQSAVSKTNVKPCHVRAIVPWDKLWYVTGNTDGVVHVLGGPPGSLSKLNSIRTEVTEVRRLALLGQDFLIATTNESIRAWRLGEGEPQPTAMVARGPTRALACSGDGKLVAFGEEDGRVVIYRREGDRLAEWDAFTLKPADDVAGAMAFSNDAKTLWVGTGRGAILAFDVKTR